MRKVLLTFLVIAFLVAFTSPVFALIRTRNVDIDDGGFGYKVAYQYITYDVGVATSVDIPVSFDTSTRYNLYYTMPFKGSLVGISIASAASLTAGSLTVDATINGTVTGLRTAINASDGVTKHAKSGGNADHRQYNYNQILFDDESPDDFGGDAYDSSHPYGKVTPLVAGDYVGVQLTSSSTIPVGTDIVVTVIILQ